MRAPTLVGGIAVILFGVWLLLDANDVVDVSFAALAPALFATFGAMLLARGLEDRGPEDPRVSPEHRPDAGKG